MNQAKLCNEFLLIVANGSFAKAAKLLDMRPSLLSKHISQLEKSLNVKLLNRSLKKISLTEKGEFFYKQAKQFMNTWNKALNQLNIGNETIQGKLRIGIPNFLQEFYQATILNFVREYKNISVEVVSIHETVSLIDYNLDALIWRENPDDDRLESYKYLKFNKVHTDVFASPDYLATTNSITTLDDLSEHNCLIFASMNTPYIWQFTEKNINVQGQIKSDSLNWLISAAVADAGLIYCPRELITQELREASLEYVFRKSQKVATAHSIYYMNVDYLNQPMRLFLHYFRDAFKNEPMSEVT